MVMWLAYLLAGILTGLLSTLFGLGGGFVVVPLLLWLLPYDGVSSVLLMHMAVGTSLLLVLFNSINSAVLHYKKGNIIFPLLYRMLPLLIVGALIGAALLNTLSGHIVKILFVLLLLGTVITAFKNEFYKPKSKQNAEIKPPHPQFLPVTLPQKISFGGVSLGTGVAASLLGIGGSVITVPFFRQQRMPMANASALAIVLAIPSSLIGSIVSLMSGLYVTNLPAYSTGYIYWPAFVGIMLGSVVSASVGIKYSNKIPDKLYGKIYATLLLIIMLSVVLK